jgi:hypothetical protein
MPTKKGAAALKRAAAEAENGEGDDGVHAENAATSKGKNKAAKRAKRSKNDTGGEDMQSLKKKKVEGKGENNYKGKSKENLDHLDNVEGLTSSDAGNKKNCPKPKRDKIESQNPAEMLARLNIRVNDACDNTCNTAGQARRAVFLFAHGAGGISPVFLCDANFSCIFMRKANSFCLVESPTFLTPPSWPAFLPGLTVCICQYQTFFVFKFIRCFPLSSPPPPLPLFGVVMLTRHPAA